MSKSELKAYVLAHRDSDEAIRALFSRRNPHAKRYPAPENDEDLQQMEEAFKQKIHEQP